MYKKLSSAIYIIFLFTLSLFLWQCNGNQGTAPDYKTVKTAEKKLLLLEGETRTMKDSMSLGRFMDIYSRVHQIYEQIPDTSRVKAGVRAFFVRYLRKLGGYHEAIREARKALVCSEKARVSDPYLYRMDLYGTLAGLYTSLNYDDSALAIYQLAIQDELKDTIPYRISSPLNNAGVYYFQKGSLDTAMSYFLIADSILRKYPVNYLKWQNLQGSIRSNIASVFLERGEYEKAGDIFKKNLQHYKKIKAHIRWVNAGIALANTQIELGDYAEAASLLDMTWQGLDTLQLRTKPIMKYWMKVKSRYLEMIGEKDKALQLIKEILEITNKENTEQESRFTTISEFLANYSSERFEESLLRVREEKAHEAARLRLQIWIVILLAIGLVVIASGLLIYYRQRNRLHESERKLTLGKLYKQENEKKLLDLQLEYKKKDLSDMALKLSLRQEWSTELYQRFLTVTSYKGSKRSREFSRLKLEILGQANIDKELSVISNNIESLNREFYVKLKSKFPNLSKTELKLCGYIKLNMSNLQIAQAQNVEPSSIKVSRYRLKKKMGLTSDQNLEHFIQSL